MENQNQFYIDMIETMAECETRRQTRLYDLVEKIKVEIEVIVPHIKINDDKFKTQEDVEEYMAEKIAKMKINEFKFKITIFDTHKAFLRKFILDEEEFEKSFIQKKFSSRLPIMLKKIVSENNGGSIMNILSKNFEILKLILQAIPVRLVISYHACHDTIFFEFFEAIDESSDSDNNKCIFVMYDIRDLLYMLDALGYHEDDLQEFIEDFVKIKAKIRANYSTIHCTTSFDNQVKEIADITESYQGYRKTMKAFKELENKDGKRDS